jgi:hypothetical protein
MQNDIPQQTWPSCIIGVQTLETLEKILRNAS